MPDDDTRHPFPGRTTRRRFLTGSAAVAGNALPLATLAQETTPGPGEAVPSVARSFDQAAFDATFSHYTIVANGVRLHYVIGGQGNPLVLLHGWPHTWYG